MTNTLHKSREYLGVGFRFPFQVTASGKLATSSYERRIEESIFFVLSTAKGERVMRPDFGCGIHDLLFESNSVGTITSMINEVRKALTQFEPRIDCLDITTESSEAEPNVILIRVDYRIRQTNTVNNYVYPFYLKEGALI